MTREEAEKELIAMLQEAEGGRSYSMEEVDAYMRELLHPKNQIYLTGDTHGRFERIISFCERQQVQPESTFIILGDVGLNYYGDLRDNRGKDKLAKIPITFFCIHGNHEMRPSEELGYQVKEYHGGKVWVQPEYPNLVFAIDGEIYDFFGHSCIVIGGAYSVDKYYRLARGYNWFEDEQPSDEIKEKVERVLSERDWKIDVVLSHTCPLRYEPAEVFLLEHCFGRLFGIVEGIVLLAEVIFNDADLHPQCAKGFAVLCIVHTQRTGDMLCLPNHVIVGGIGRWEPLGQKGCRFARLQRFAIGFELLFDIRKSLPLTFGTHQGKEIVIASILCNVGDVLFHRLRLIVRKPLEDGAEDAALPDTATDISCEKQRFHGEISILCVCAEESICDLLVTLPSECADGRKQIQTLRLGGLICNRSVFRMGQIRFVL